MLMRVMHHGVQTSVQFWCALIRWYGSGVSSRFYVEIGEVLPMVMVINFGVLWFYSGDQERVDSFRWELVKRYL